jgi:hypothetical protein
MWHLLLAEAVAAPTFVAAPRVASVAGKAWRAATACAGWEAAAFERVEIVVGAVPDGFHGRALVKGPTVRTVKDGDGNVVSREVVDEGGIYRIELADDTPRTLAHEVAHAWTHEGPTALVEGATELLADCVSERLPRVVPARPSGADPRLETLEDLRGWTYDSPARSAAYLASARLLRLAAEVIPRERLWREAWTWASFLDALGQAGPKGEALRAAVEGGPEGQRSALADLDGDGVPELQEAWAAEP